jgi:hypothetical protein
VRVVGATPFTGSLVVGSSGTITVKGNNSFGISAEAPINGSIINSGALSLTGNNGRALQETAGVTGAVTVTGATTSTGPNSNAIVLGGDVGGRFSVYSTVSSTGYTSVARPTDSAALSKIQGTPADIQLGGVAIAVQGSVGGGIFIGAPPVGTASGSTADLDGDGVADGAEGTGSITSYGASPALTIGGARDVSIGAYGTGVNAYGLLIRGLVTGLGVYDNVPATALEIGGGGGIATLTGGVRLVGTIESTAYNADSTAVHVAAGGVVPELRNENSIGASILSPDSGTAPHTATATAILIDPGATLSRITNYGTIGASATSNTSSASAIADHSGTLSVIENQGAIAAVVTAGTTGATPSGRTIALDLSANTSGVTLRQEANPTPFSVSSTSVTSAANTSANATTTTTSGNAVTTTVTANGATTATTVTTTPPQPSIVGDVLLGSGPNTVQLLGGSLTGALDLGSGSASLTIDNGAAMVGALSHSGGSLSVNVAAGVLNNTNPVTLNATSLTVGGGGTLYFAVDPANARSSMFVVAGTASLADGAKLGVTLQSSLSQPQSFTLIKANVLQVGDVGGLVTQTPYFFTTSLRTDEAAGTVTVDVTHRPAATAGLNPAQTAAYEAVYQALPSDPAVEAAYFAQYDKAAFSQVLSQSLPDYAGGVFEAARLASAAISRAATEPDHLTGEGYHAWAEELVYGGRLSAGATTGFAVAGFGFVGGVSGDLEGVGQFGTTLAFTSADVTRPHDVGDDRVSVPQVEAGLTYHTARAGWLLDARGAAGYTWFKGQRQLLVQAADGTVSLDRQATSKSQGYSLTGRVSLAYEAAYHGWFVRPQMAVDYFRLDEGGQTETGGGNGFDLIVADRTGQEASALASVVFGGEFGFGVRWRPQLELGYRDAFSGGAPDTTAQFAGGPAFVLQPAQLHGGSKIARAQLSAFGDSYSIGVEAGVEDQTKYISGDARVNVKLLF